ncbi:MAG TPA: hypothetical protein VGM98_25545 [Schlesneria sp.]
MRTEDIVGVTCLSLLLLGLGFVIWGVGSNRAEPNARNQKSIATGLAIGGSAFLIFGLLSSYFVRNSPRPEAIGTIENLRRTSGKSAGSQFFLAVNGGPIFALRTRYHGYGIQEGEVAKVRFVEYSRSVLELTMLSGSDQGWQLTESDGSVTYLLLSLAGVACWWGAFRVYRKPTILT